ncbi:MAG: hypothetical protein Hals2KO_07310 [Halioglobus sp.]
MNDDALKQIDAFATPGGLLKEAREAQGMSEREAADRLNLMPDYVGILERDDYESLRSPAFAKGYIRAYGRLLSVDEKKLLQLFDELPLQNGGAAPRRIETRPLQLQRTGLGVVVGLAVLVVFVALLWWQGASSDRLEPIEAFQQETQAHEADLQGAEHRGTELSQAVAGER